MESDSLVAMRLRLAPSIAAAAAFDGWSDEAVRAAAVEQGIAAPAALFAFSDGAMAMIDAWTASIDQAMAEALPAEQLAPLKIRERIRALVSFRLAAMERDKEALRRALSIMAMPQNAPRALRIGWRSADAMWRLAGDTATDFNHYTKRMMLGALYASTLAVFVDDASDGHAETRAFLERRIEGVMRFEKAKARLIRSDAERFSPMRFLGRLRYPAR